MSLVTGNTTTQRTSRFPPQVRHHQHYLLEFCPSLSDRNPHGDCEDALIWIFPSTDFLILFVAASWIMAGLWISDLGSVSSGDDEANLVLWYVFSIFFYEVDDSCGCVDFLCCLAEIFANFLGFLLGFLKDFIGNLQRDLCELFSLDFCFFWGGGGVCFY